MVAAPPKLRLMGPAGPKLIGDNNQLFLSQQLPSLTSAFGPRLRFATPQPWADVTGGCGNRRFPPGGEAPVCWGVTEGGAGAKPQISPLLPSGARRGRRGQGLGPLPPLGTPPGVPYSNREGGLEESPPIV